METRTVEVTVPADPANFDSETKVILFDLILYVPSTIFQLNREGSSWVESELSEDKTKVRRDFIYVLFSGRVLSPRLKKNIGLDKHKF